MMHPVAPRPADRLPADAARDRGARLARSGGDGDAGRARLAAVRAQVQALDQAVFDAVAVTPTPDLDRYLARLSSAANYSRLWLLVAAGMAAVGGVRGRRAAGLGVLAIGAASAVSNLALKPLARRRRPVHTGGDRPSGRGGWRRNGVGRHPPDLVSRLRDQLRRHGSTGGPAAGVVTWAAREVNLYGGAGRLPAGIDGESRMLGLPIRCEIRPGVLRVLLPR
jgi:hypothetical protein